MSYPEALGWMMAAMIAALFLYVIGMVLSDLADDPAALVPIGGFLILLFGGAGVLAWIF